MDLESKLKVIEKKINYLYTQNNKIVKDVTLQAEQSRKIDLVLNHKNYTKLINTLDHKDKENSSQPLSVNTKPQSQIDLEKEYDLKLKCEKAEYLTQINSLKSDNENLNKKISMMEMNFSEIISK